MRNPTPYLPQSLYVRNPFDSESITLLAQRNLADYTIDFFVQVLGMNFHNAMRQITAS